MRNLVQRKAPALGAAFVALASVSNSYAHSSHIVHGHIGSAVVYLGAAVALVAALAIGVVALRQRANKKSNRVEVKSDVA